MKEERLSAYSGMSNFILLPIGLSSKPAGRLELRDRFSSFI
jgi:hypothetical protein